MAALYSNFKMMYRAFKTGFGQTQLLLLLLLSSNLFLLHAAASTTSTRQEQLLRGFTATPDPSLSSFQSLLTDSAGNYSLGFLRVNRSQLALAVVHVPSTVPLWIANATRLLRWSDQTQLLFNGSLVISDSRTRVSWSTNTSGDRVWLSNTSNLLIQKLHQQQSPSVILWQSFDFPSDTLVENQNFTTAMALVSTNELYSMRLGFDFIGLYARFNPDSDPGQIYLKHKALEAKADVIEGQGPIYAILSPDGFLGMYQNASIPVDVQSFNSYQQPGTGNRRLRLETDGNLKGYYWTGSSWVLDFQAISETCELPSPCGSYGLCKPGKACSCLDNRTNSNSGGCAPPANNGGDICRGYRVLRITGVELPYKELMGYTIIDSLQKCETACEVNCTCWGAVYSNSSGFCYTVDYPIQTLVSVGDQGKVGYIKVMEGAGKHKVNVGFGVGIGLLGVAILIFCGVVGLGYYRFSRRRRNRGVSAYVEEERMGGVGPYKDLASASFKSIQLIKR